MDPPAARQNGRSSSQQLVIDKDARRPLFAGAGQDRGTRSLGAGAQRTHERTDRYASSSPEAKDIFSRTRIPRPKSNGVSLAEAWRLAGEEEERRSSTESPPDGSPSPAPRPRQSREPERARLATKSLSRLAREDHRRHASDGAVRLGMDENSPLRGQVDLEEENRNALFRNSRIGPRVAEAGRTLAKKTSGEEGPRNRSGGSPSWISRYRSDAEQLGDGGARGRGGSGPRSNGKDVAIPSIENGEDEDGLLLPRPSSAFEPASPNKSYAWQIEDDFTAGDLQVSDSPMLRVDSIDSRSLGDRFADALDRSPERPPRPQTAPRPRNTKLDDIMAREMEAERQIPLVDKSGPRPRNTKLDEIRQREIDGLSRRALATIRLDELREINSQARSQSPEETRKSRESTPAAASGDAEKSNSGQEGERVPNTPVTIFRRQGSQEGQQQTTLAASSSLSDSRPGMAQKREDSQDLLRRLARATSASPAPEPAKKASPEQGEKEATPLPQPQPQQQQQHQHTAKPAGPRRTHNPELKETQSSKPAVEFAGIPRPRSTDSSRETNDKRSSMANSDSDPTERIEQEMKLFAPADEKSERGSTRAPSPSPDSDSDDEDDARRESRADETPRPVKRDPLAMPTPKVTGAYVETPSTIKVAKVEDKIGERLGGRARIARTDDDDAGSDSGLLQPKQRSASGSRLRRRARSLSQRRHPLVNSAKPPTVRDDLLELQRLHNVEDSTLDDFEELWKKKRPPSPPATKPTIKIEVHSDEELDRRSLQEEKLNPKKEMERYGAIDKRLRLGIDGIREAKKGIERLEGRVSHSDREDKPKAEQDEDKVEKRAEKTRTVLCETCTSGQHARAASVGLYIPRLYSRDPQFRLTLLGIVVAILSFWYAAESAICMAQCRPTTCASPPCVWSPDDPVFGYALPMKLDQIVLNGMGRYVFSRALRDAEDAAADAWDALLGRDILNMPFETMDLQQRRRYKRKLRERDNGSSLRRGNADDRERWQMWRQAREAWERRKEAVERNGDVWFGDDDTFASDERVW